MSGPLKKSQPTSIADVMAKLLAQKGMTERLAQVSAMDDWSQVVGAQRQERDGRGAHGCGRRRTPMAASATP